MRRTRTLLVTAAALIAGTVSSGAAEQSDPGNLRQFYRNQFATLVLARLKPDDVVKLEGSMRAALYFLDDGQAEIRFSGSTRDDLVSTQGDIVPLRGHALELHNTGEEHLEYLFIRSLVSPLDADPPGPSAYLIRTVHTPPVPGNNGIRQVFDNDVFRIIEIALPPGKDIPTTVHLSGMYYALNDHRMEFVSSDGLIEPHQYEQGDIRWVNSEEYAIRNTGNKPMHSVFMGIKPVARYDEYEP